MLPEQHITITSRCYCGANEFPASVPVSRLPLRQTMCHCAACRKVTGTYFCSNVAFPGKTPLFDTTSPPNTISRYATSDIAARYFCNICSSHLILHYGAADNKSDNPDVEEEWNACSGCLELNVDELPEGKTLHKLLQHIWLNDTNDGGLLKQYANEPPFETVPAFYCPGKNTVGEKEAKEMAGFVPKPVSNDDRLEAKCRCGSVNLLISRPLSEDCYPPHASCPDTDSFDPPHNSAKDAWWIRPSLIDKSKRDRFLGSSCVCDSCRRIAGNDIQQWIFVPTSCIKLVRTSGDKVGEEAPWPEQNELQRLEEKNEKGEAGYPFGIKIYKSSPGVTRGFCRTCGANVFWCNPKIRHNMLDVAAGLISGIPEDKSTGSRRDDWVDWKVKYVSSAGDARKRGELVDRLAAGLKEAWDEDAS